MENFKVIVVEDVPLELKGTLGIIKNDIPEAEIIGTADSEPAYWRLLKQQKPDKVEMPAGDRPGHGVRVIVIHPGDAHDAVQCFFLQHFRT